MKPALVKIPGGFYTILTPDRAPDLVEYGERGLLLTDEFREWVKHNTPSAQWKEGENLSILMRFYSERDATIFKLFHG